MVGPASSLTGWRLQADDGGVRQVDDRTHTAVHARTPKIMHATGGGRGHRLRSICLFHGRASPDGCMSAVESMARLVGARWDDFNLMAAAEAYPPIISLRIKLM